MSSIKVLVIGGAGYIGSHVVKALQAQDYAVTVYDNMSTGQACNLSAKTTCIQGDILDEEKLDSVMAQGFDAVIHLAAKKAVGESMTNPQLYARNNLNGSINIFNAMLNNGVKNVVFSSSAAVYGIPQYLPLDEKHPVNPLSFYGFTKAEIERVMAWYGQLKDFHYVALRYFNAVGYASDGSIRGKEIGSQNLLPIVMDTLSGRREKMLVFGNDYNTPDGTCLRDYVHVEDLAQAHVAAIKKLLKEPQSYSINLSTGKGTSVLEIINAAERISGKKVNYEFAPRRAGDPAVLIADNEMAQKILNWTPHYTDIDEIVKTVWNLEEK